MVRPFISIVFLLVSLVLIMGGHTLLFPYTQHKQSLQSITKLTKMTRLAYASAYDASKNNLTYPEMQNLDRMDFVYER